VPKPQEAANIAYPNPRQEQTLAYFVLPSDTENINFIKLSPGQPGTLRDIELRTSSVANVIKLSFFVTFKRRGKIS